MEANRVPASFFSPTAVAIVGASEAPGRIGSGLWRSITAGFRGPVCCVNPKHATMWGGPCFRSVAELPGPVSHAFIAVGRDGVLPALRQCVAAGIPNVVVVSAGFKEADARGAALEAELQDVCRGSGTRLLGPNTLGFLSTAAGFNGTFLPDEFRRGGVSVISQSGGVGMALLAALRDYRCGVAKWVGVGNEAVLTANDFLQFFADDEETRVIAVCFEGLRDMPGFLELAAAVNRTKPVVLLRDGKGSVGMRAAASHTGTLVQSPEVLSGVFGQLGLQEADGCRQCAVMLKALSLSRPAEGTRAVLLSNTAGPSILAADALEAAGVDLPQPSPALQASIDERAGVAMGLKNPADISSNGLSPRNYGVAAGALLGSGEYDVLLGFFSMNRHLQLPEQELIDAACRAGRPAVACLLSNIDDFYRYDRRPERFGIPCYWEPRDAADAVAAIVRRGQVLRRPARRPQPVLTGGQRAAVQAVLDEFPGDVTLPERDARRLLQAAGVALAVPALAADEDAAAAAADRCGYPVCLKLHSARLTHKTDVGGVRLNLRTAEEVRAAFREMLPALRRLDPDALLTVQPMAPEGFELIVGGVRTPALGPLVMAGLGGVYSELLRDTAFRLAPLAPGEAAEQLRSLRCGAALEGFRGISLDRDAAADLLGRVGDLLSSFPRLAELDLNPCRVYGRGLEVLDARAVLRAADV